MQQTASHPRVLIVEDESLVGLELRDSLQRLGYDVTAVVDSGDHVIATVMRDAPDIVLMDVHLKSFTDGIDAAERLKALRDIPIIYMTAYVDSAMKKRAAHTNPAAYLLKPIDNAVLAREIQAALGRPR